MNILVILGNKLNRYDTLSQAGLSRVVGGLKVHSHINFDKIIISGGVTGGSSISEAKAMEKEFLKAGVSEDIIILEEKSRNTIENGRFTVAMLKEMEGDKVVFVLSSKEHIARRFHNPVEIFDGQAYGRADIKLLYVGV